jgi:hypothetical protein
VQEEIMSDIFNAYMRSVVFLGASLVMAPNVAVAQEQSSSQVCKQDQLAGQEGDEKETKSEVLARCDSVIRPPQVGDQEMVEPAPSVGRAPVIEPEQN